MDFLVLSQEWKTAHAIEALQAITIENYYSMKAGKSRPMDIEWAKSGISGELFIIQARPETVESQKTMDAFEVYHLDKKGHVLARARVLEKRLPVVRHGRMMM